MIGKSRMWAWSSSTRSMNNAYVSSRTSLMRASWLSTLLMTTMIGRSLARALRSTKRVWGSGPSEASTRSRTPSTISNPRSTSPPKSACPGVSMMLMVTFSPASVMCSTAVFFATIVMPFSRSRSIESMTWVLTSWLARNAPDCHSIASTSVVFPWSTWAMIATLRRSLRMGMRVLRKALLEATASPQPCEVYRGCQRPSSKRQEGYARGLLPVVGQRDRHIGTANATKPLSDGVSRRWRYQSDDAERCFADLSNRSTDDAPLFGDLDQPRLVAGLRERMIENKHHKGGLTCSIHHRN